MQRTAIFVGLLLSVTSLLSDQPNNNPLNSLPTAQNQPQATPQGQKEKQQLAYTLLFTINQQAQANNAPIITNQQTLTQSPTQQMQPAEKKNGQQCNETQCNGIVDKVIYFGIKQCFYLVRWVHGWW
jgi:hypothetical protein